MMRSSPLLPYSVPESAQDLRELADPGEQDSPVASGCAHCGTRLPVNVSDDYCCIGCRTVAEALAAGGFERYYALLDQPLSPVGDLHLERRDRKWLLPLQAQVDAAKESTNLLLAVQGIRCAACVWLIQELFRGLPGARAILVTPGLGRLSLRVGPSFAVQAFVTRLEALGYLAAPPGEAPVAKPSADLLLRASLVSALAANSMMFSLATYLGLQAGALFSFLHSINYGLSALAVVVGAPVFFRSAVHSLRSGVLHLDLPIALGIGLTFVAATWSFLSGNEQAAYYDSLAVFVALMLWGRYLQGRVADRNRAQLIPYDADHGLIVRRRLGAGMEDVSAHEVTVGDRLLLTPGDIVPVAGRLAAGTAVFSLDWINGEPEPVVFDEGQEVPAGAVHVGESPVEVLADEAYGASAVRALLSAPQMRRCDLDRVTEKKRSFAPLYVAAVLLAAACSFAVSFLRTGLLADGLAAATAACVVSCPCSIGLALPLAQELIQSKLRRVGLFVREVSFLERAAQVDAIAFDKTGTLTTGALQLCDASALDRLSGEQRGLLYAMVAGSTHPHALSLRRLLETRFSGQLRLSAALHASREVCGAGIELRQDETCFRLGRADWACDAAPAKAADAGVTTVFSRNGVELQRFKFREVPRDAVADECKRLRELGYRLYILSGDAQPSVDAMADFVGVPRERAYGGKRPEDKARVLSAAEHQHTLMIGDGINDNLTLEQAFAAGTPSLDRPAVSTRADFYYVTAGLAPVTAGLMAGRALSRIRRRAYGFFAVYNFAAVALSIAGSIEPWVAAVLMPTSSVVSVLAVVAAVNRASKRWTS